MKFIENLQSSIIIIVLNLRGPSGNSGMISLFKQRSQGLVSDTWSLKFEKFAEIPCSLPPLSEQKKIAIILSDIDQYLKKMKQLIMQ